MNKRSDDTAVAIKTLARARRKRGIKPAISQRDKAFLRKRRVLRLLRWNHDD
jgi:hypothetical protein